MKLFYILILLKLIKNDCVLIQDSLTSRGRKTKGNEIYGHKMDLTDVDMTKNPCPDFYKESLGKGDNFKVCCTNSSLRIMSNNFSTLDSLLSTNGCPVCSSSFRRFLCYINCSIDQHTFIDNVKTIENEINNEIVEITTSDIFIDMDFACNLFQSCTKTGLFSLLPGLNNYQGAFKFLLTQGPTLYKDENDLSPLIEFLPNFYNKNDKKTEKSLISYENNLKCNNTYENNLDLYGYSLKENYCDCSVCYDSCDSNYINSYFPPRNDFKGFDFYYFYLFIFSFIIIFITIIYRRHQSKFNENIENIDEEERVENKLKYLRYQVKSYYNN